MIWLRRLILFLPLALLAFFGVAFVSVRATQPRKLNQLAIGSIGEAKNLNPILSTTTADGDIEDRIFHGLVKYDENINVVPDLAEWWGITQYSTLFFATADEAREAMSILQAARADWSGWKLKDVRQDGNKVVLFLLAAGTSYQETLLPQLEKLKPLPVSFVRVAIADKAKLDGQPAGSKRLLERIESEVKRTPGLSDRLHSTFVNSSSDFDLVVAGDTVDFVSLAGRILRAGDGKDALGRCAVAETFPVLNEPQIVFHLRSGVRWQDGQPFTARDVEFTYQMLLDEQIASPRRSDFELVRSFTVVDEDTIRIVYRKPYAPCLTSWSMGMLPRHILEGKSSQWWAQHFNRTPIGTGAYRFDAWQSGESVRVKRNPDYWEGAPRLEWVTTRVIPDALSLRLLFETGELDFWGVEPYAMKSFLNNPRYDIFQRIPPDYEYVAWNLNRPMFQDVRVRQALAHAVNIPQMIQYILYGQGVQSTGIFPPQMWYFNPHIKPFDYDPDKARAMLAEAGWKPGPDGVLQKDGKRFSFALITSNGSDIAKDIATLVQADLKRIGIRVDVQLYEWAVFISEHIDKQDFDACVLAWDLGYEYDQYQIWHSSQTKPGQLNFVSYKNREVDRLLELARSEFDQDKARRHLWELQRIIYEEQPYLFTVVPMATAAMHRGEFRVKRPDEKGGWIEEPVRSTKVGFRVYQDWWYRPAMKP